MKKPIFLYNGIKLAKNYKVNTSVYKHGRVCYDLENPDATPCRHHLLSIRARNHLRHQIVIYPFFYHGNRKTYSHDCWLYYRRKCLFKVKFKPLMDTHSY